MRPMATLGRAAILLAIGPTVASAQASLFGGAGAALPLGDFADVVDPGIEAFAGGTLGLGTGGVSLRAMAYYARHPHEIEGDRSDVFDVSVLAGYRVARVSGVGVSAWAGAGGMVHSRRSSRFPGLDTSRRGLSVSVGASASRPTGAVNVLVIALYTRGLGDLDTAAFPTAHLTIGAGVSVPIVRQ